MTAFIVQVSLGDTPRGTVEYQALFAVGALLFIITLLLNIASSRILKRFRETYE
jgi:phosphate transport system permease protein